MRVAGPFSSGAAVGSAGAATANQTSTIKLSGLIRGVYLDYQHSPPATTDVTVEGATAPTQPILSLDNANTDTWKYPHHNVHDAADGAAVSGVYVPVPFSDYVKVTIAGADASDSVDVYLLVSDY